MTSAAGASFLASSMVVADGRARAIAFAVSVGTLARWCWLHRAVHRVRGRLTEGADRRRLGVRRVVDAPAWFLVLVDDARAFVRRAGALQVLGRLAARGPDDPSSQPALAGASLATATRWWRAGVAAAGAAVVVVGLLVGWAAAGLIAAAVVAWVAVAADVARGRSSRTIEQQLPVLVDHLAAAARAGLPLLEGVREGASRVTGALRDDLGHLVAAADAGVPLPVVLDEWRVRRPLRGVGLVVATLTMGIELGARGRPLDRVASTLRERLAVAAERRAGAAQAKAQAAVMVLAPVAFVVANVARDPGGFGSVFLTPVGLACLATAAMLDGGGAWWMARIMRATR